MCVETWQAILAQGMNVETPEPLVNNAWRNLIIQDFSLINGDRLNYSAGNQYEKMYAAESSDAALPLMSWGHEIDQRRLLRVILDLVDKRLPWHFASQSSMPCAAFIGKPVMPNSSKRCDHAGKRNWI